MMKNDTNKDNTNMMMKGTRKRPRRSRLPSLMSSRIGSSSTEAKANDNDAMTESIAVAETRLVKILRMAVAVAVIISGVVISGLVYQVTRQRQEEQHVQVTGNKPVVYALVILVIFSIEVILLMTYSCVVDRRQRVMVKKVIENAQRTNEIERSLNEFLAHEIRNPLSAAISASTFVASAVHEAEPLVDPETRRHVREDITVVNASLSWINDFLRSMLEIYKATGSDGSSSNDVELHPVDLKRDILVPVADMILEKRHAKFQVIVDCPDNLIVQTDPIRLKQVISNLVRNASLIVREGFIRMRAEVIDQQVFLYVEDSGPGVAEEKRNELFCKYQQGLDLLSRHRQEGGTPRGGIGLSLSKKLMEIVNGDLYLDTCYESGVEGCPGARFVLELNTSPMDIESALLIPAFQDGTHSTSSQSSSVDCQDISSSHKHDEASTIHQQPSREAGVSVILETSPPPSSTPSSSLMEEKADLPKELSCLFVDDDKMLRKLFMRAVKKVAPTWKISEAGSGEEAVAFCQDRSLSSSSSAAPPFDLIFMDQYMESADEKMLGTETVHALRSKGIASKICGLSANDVKPLFLESGADDFLLKPMPCKPEDLKSVLLRILDIKQSAAEMQMTTQACA